MVERDEGARHHRDVHEVPEVPEVGAGVEHHAQVQDLERALHGEDGGEAVVGLLQDDVDGGLVVHGILHGQRDGAEDDDEHDEHVEQLLGHQPVHRSAQSAIQDENLEVCPLGYGNAITTMTKPCDMRHMWQFDHF